MSPKSNLTIWCNYRFRPDIIRELRRAVRPHRLIQASHLTHTDRAPERVSPGFSTADIVIGQFQLQDILQAPNVRWVHITSASYTRYDNPRFLSALKQRGTFVTNTSGVFAEPCAQHALAMILGMVRQLPQAGHTQSTDRRWLFDERRSRSRLLNGERVVILGFGAIAVRLVQLLAPFKMNISALRRSRGPIDGVTILSRGNLRAALGQADHIINLLPDGPKTHRFVDGNFLKACRRGALFYNLGRGVTVDQPALIRALKSRGLGGAYLDVVEPEPLPPAHPLWRAPNCYISPHTAGGHTLEQERLVEHFAKLFNSYAHGKIMTPRII